MAFNLPSKLDPAQDGITHINVYSKGKTPLGSFLSNFSDCWVETDDGPFRTIEGYWYWLISKTCRMQDLREELRVTRGWESKQLGRKLIAKDWDETEEFQKKICKAIAVKVLSYPQVAEDLKRSTLPLVHYYVTDEGRSIEVRNGLWVISFLEHLRDELRYR